MSAEKKGGAGPAPPFSGASSGIGCATIRHRQYRTAVWKRLQYATSVPHGRLQTLAIRHVSTAPPSGTPCGNAFNELCQYRCLVSGTQYATSVPALA
eukprot:2687260-Rhodomonas_salina.1